MKKIVILIFVLLIIKSVSSQDCKYRINEVSQFDGSVKKELYPIAIWENTDKDVPSFSRTIHVSIRRENNTKYVKFKEYSSTRNWGSSFREKIIKIKLEDGNVVSIKNWDESMSTSLDEEGKLLPSQIKLLKASPIKVIRIDMPEVYTKEDMKFVDLEISGDAK